MKILKIVLQNINSLQSEKPFVIDFESDFFKDVGLYAITGTTGSGKTTILDAITIALYHKVPRFNRNSKATLTEIVSQGSSFALAQVIFENDKEIYEAHWSLRIKTPKGKFLKKAQEEVRIKNLSSGDIIASKKTDVAKAIIQIIRLNYNQFLRSSMLAQGEFSAFLSAPSKEKGVLLEQITGEVIYKRIGEAVGDRIREENALLLQIKSKINSDDILSEEYREELEKEAKSIDKIESDIRLELLAKNKIISFFKQVEKLKEEEEINTKNTNELKEFILRNKTVFEQLKNHNSAKHFRQEILEYDRLFGEIQQSNLDEKRLVIEQNLLVKSIEKINSDRVKYKENLDYSEDSLLKWNPKLDAVIKIDNELLIEKRIKKELETEVNSNSSQINDLKADIDTHLKEITALEIDVSVLKKSLSDRNNLVVIDDHLSFWNVQFSQITNNKSNIKDLENEVRDLNLEFKKKQESLVRGNNKLKKEKVIFDQLKLKQKLLEESAEKLNLEILIEQNNKLQKSITLLKEGLLISIEYSKLKNHINELEKQVQVLMKKETMNMEQKKLLDEKLCEAKNSLRDAEIILEQEKTIKNLEEERKKLVEGEPCNLCGSKNHPLVNSYQNMESSKTMKLVEKRGKYVEELVNKRNLLNIELIQIQTTRESLLIQVVANKKSIKESESKFANLNLSLKIDDEKILENIKKDQEIKLIQLSSDIVRAQSKNREKEQANKVLSLKKEEIDLTLNGISKLTDSLKHLTENISKIKKRITDINVQNDTIFNELKTHFISLKIDFPSTKDYSTFIIDKKAEIQSYRKDIEQKHLNESRLKILETKLKSKTDLFNKEIEKQLVLEHKCKKNTQLILTLTSERVAILPIDITPEAKRTELHLAIKKAKDQYKKINEHWQEKEKKKTSLTKEIENQLIVSKRLLKTKSIIDKKLTDLIQDSIFDTLETVRASLLTEDKYKNYTSLKKEAEDRQIIINSNKTKLVNLKIELEKQTKSQQSLEKTTQQKEELEFSLKELLEKKGGILEKINKDNEVKARNAKVYEQISFQEKSLKKWKDLNFVLGNNRDSFNTYVQRLTLHQLIQLANIHLYKLNRRYSLKLPKKYKSGEELNFHLIDHYRTDIARLVDTSSGGERFIISLALALGLSDLSSQTVNIDSLFIDEGFGSLDQNTLEVVISTLETLQSQGKMIGIISHVENLKERIPTQIKVIKKSNGISRVEIG